MTVESSSLSLVVTMNALSNVTQSLHNSYETLLSLFNPKLGLKVELMPMEKLFMEQALVLKSYSHLLFPI